VVLGDGADAVHEPALPLALSPEVLWSRLHVRVASELGSRMVLYI